MERRPFVVGDPVHRYVGVMGHERVVVDSPITQRLRHVSQTGMVQSVFPEARTARFSHSLGAMHLASRFLCACLENATAEVQKRFFDDLEGVFNKFVQLGAKAFTPMASLDDLGALLDCGGVAEAGLRAARIVWAAPLSAPEAARRRHLTAFAECGTRLAALFHDLGHLPFSHDFEFAFRDYVGITDVLPALDAIANAGMPPHEVVGHELVRLALIGLVSDQEASPAGNQVEAGLAVRRLKATRAAYLLAQEILDTPSTYSENPKPSAGAVAWLHSLIDGDIDVDRADYLKRDGRNLGPDFGQYDLDRLAVSLILEQHPDLGLVTAVDEKGVSAVEAYFLARSRSHQLMIHHHKVVQIAAAFRYASTRALSAGKGDDLLALMAELKGELGTNDVLKRFSRLDDVWWLETLRKFEDCANLDLTKPADRLLGASLGLLLRREPRMTAVWKRAGDLNNGDLARWNRLVDTNTYGEEIREAFEKEGFVLVQHHFRAFSRRIRLDGGSSEQPEAVVQVRTRSGLRPLDRFSPSIAALAGWYEKDLHFHLFAVSTEGVTVDALRAKAAALFAAWEAKFRSQSGESVL